MTPVVHAAPIVGGTSTHEYFNTFITRLFPGTAFNPGNVPFDAPVESNGVLTTVWENQVGDQIAFENVSIIQNGVFGGLPFEILAGTLQAPELGPFGGAYQNVVQDASDPGYASGDPSSLTSALRHGGGQFAQVFFRGTPDEIYLYGDEPYIFESVITSLPYEVGTEFIGLGNAAGGPVNIRVRLGVSPDPSADPIIGQALPGGIVRITRIVPEPSTLLISAIALLGLATSRARRRKD